MRPGRGLLVYPCFKPFHVAILKRSNVAVGISTKATDREDICLQTVFLVFHQTLVLSISRILHTPRFPCPMFPTPHVFHTQDLVPQGFSPHVFHVGETAMILLAALHKLLLRKRTSITLSMVGTS